MCLYLLNRQFNYSFVVTSRPFVDNGTVKGLQNLTFIFNFMLYTKI